MSIGICHHPGQLLVIIITHLAGSQEAHHFKVDDDIARVFECPEVAGGDHISQAVGVTFSRGTDGGIDPDLESTQVLRVSQADVHGVEIEVQVHEHNLPAGPSVSPCLI